MKKNMNKILVIALAVCLLGMTAMAATLAWLISTPDAVTNTFVVGSKVVITLDESDDLDLKVVPGKTITKDPVVTVDAVSEDCWVFVKIDSELPVYSADPANEGFTWAIDDTEGWTLVDGETNVWAIKYTGDAGDSYNVLKDNKVVVSSQYNMVGMASPADDLDMVITAYAIQADYLTGDGSAAAAWALLNDQMA